MTKPGENEAIEAEIRTAIIEKLTTAGVVRGDDDWWDSAADDEAAMIADALLPELRPFEAAVRADERRAVAAEIADKIEARRTAHIQPDKENSYYDRGALVSGVLPDGRTHYFCAAFPGCMSDGRKAMAVRERQRARILAAASGPVRTEQ